MPENFNVLKDLLDEFRRETEMLDAELARNRQGIQEADAYVAGLTESETEDFRVFSPRKAEILHKNELEMTRGKRAVCEAAFQKLTKRRALVSGYMEKLEDALACLQEDVRLQARTAGDLQEASAENLEKLALRIEKSCEDMEKRPFQAKQELVIVAKNLQETAKKIRDTVWLERI